jgi:predicted Zn-dependent protease with MMP-like domain
MSPQERERFDVLVRRAIDDLPAQFRRALDHIPVIVEDQPSPTMKRELLRDGLIEDPDDELLGLHTGRPLTEGWQNDHAELPTQIHLFRRAILAEAGGWEAQDVDDAVAHEVKVTLLHELGHHFGLDEDDLDRLGYA